MSRVVEVWIVTHSYEEGGALAEVFSNKEAALDDCERCIRDMLERESDEEIELEVAQMRRTVQRFAGYSNGSGRQITLTKQLLIIPERQAA